MWRFFSLYPFANPQFTMVFKQTKKEDKTKKQKGNEKQKMINPYLNTIWLTAHTQQVKWFESIYKENNRNIKKHTQRIFCGYLIELEREKNEGRDRQYVGINVIPCALLAIYFNGQIS